MAWAHTHTPTHSHIKSVNKQMKNKIIICVFNLTQSFLDTKSFYLKIITHGNSWIFKKCESLLEKNKILKFSFRESILTVRASFQIAPSLHAWETKHNVAYLMGLRLPAFIKKVLPMSVRIDMMICVIMRSEAQHHSGRICQSLFATRDFGP